MCVFPEAQNLCEQVTAEMLQALFKQFPGLTEVSTRNPESLCPNLCTRKPESLYPKLQTLQTVPGTYRGPLFLHPNPESMCPKSRSGPETHNSSSSPPDSPRSLPEPPNL